MKKAIRRLNGKEQWRRADEGDYRPMARGQKWLSRYAMIASLTLCIAGGRDPVLDFSAALIGIVLGFVLRKSPSESARWALGIAITVAAIGTVVSPGVAPWLLTATLGLWMSTVSSDLVRASSAARSIAPTLVGVGYTLTNTEALWVTAVCTSAIAAALWAAAWSSEVDPNLNKGRRSAGRLLAISALAVPLGLAMFVLFPRVPLGFNEQSGSDGRATTGLSSTMTPGSMSELVQSDRQMFQASFHVETLDRTQMYWRAMVLDQFDGTTWTVAPGPAVSGAPGVADPSVRSGRALGYTVKLPGSMGKMVPLLDLSSSRGVTLRSGVALDITLLPAINGVFQNFQFEGSATAVTAIAFPDQTKKAWSAPGPQDIELPARGNPRVRALAKQWAVEADGQPEGIVSKFQKMILEGPFRYTLRPPKWGSDGMDQFLFKAQSGFCEHYASTFVFMMRAAGIPARVVIGFQGGDVEGRNVQILARDAHAWAEIWKTDKGWERVDPTGFIDPSRVEDGTRQTLSRGFGSWSRLKGWAQDVNTNWNQRIVEYNQEQQQNLWKELKERPLASAFKLFLAIAGAKALRWAWLRALSEWRWRRMTPAQRLLSSFGTVLARLRKDGLLVTSQATATEVSACVKHWPHGRAKKKLMLQRWLIRYEQARYGRPEAAEVLAVANWIKSWRGLRSFRG